jgi:uncharacterized membrane-anchored protein
MPALRTKAVIPALSLILVLASGHARAEAPPSADTAAEQAEAPAGADEGDDAAAEFERSLRYQTGDVRLGDDLATLRLGTSFHYLSPEDTERVLVAWGNPPGSKSLGMLLPAAMTPLQDDSWAVIVTYSEDGHVDDDDAADLDFGEVLSDMQKDTEEANAERVKDGYAAVHLVGWAEPPHYDASTHKLYWAKELDFGGPTRSLNYDIRVLGRKGVLELSAVAAMDRLPAIKAAMPQVLNVVDFNQGSRYADFDPDLDQVAAYGIGALVAGKLVAKAGLLKIIIAAALASKKLLVAGAAGLAVLAKKLFSKRSPEST